MRHTTNRSLPGRLLLFLLALTLTTLGQLYAHGPTFPPLPEPYSFCDPFWCQWIWFWSCC